MTLIDSSQTVDLETHAIPIQLILCRESLHDLYHVKFRMSNTRNETMEFYARGISRFPRNTESST